MIIRKDVIQSIEKFDPTEKQANRIYMLVRNMSIEDFRSIVSMADDIQDVFEKINIQSSAAVDNYSFINLRNYKNIPSNAIHQFDKDVIGFWFKADHGEWFFIGEKRLAGFRARWNERGEIIFPAETKR